MNLFLILLVPPFLYAVSNHIDKYLLTKYFYNISRGALMIFSSIAAICILPFIFIFAGQSLQIGPIGVVLMIGSGVLNMVAVLFYLYAITGDEVSTVVPIFQLIAVMNYFLGLIFLGEILNIVQITGSLFIIFGAILITLELDGHHPILKKSVLYLMLASCFLYSIDNLLFKVVAVEGSFWGATFWTYVGWVVFGLFSVTVMTKWRTDFIQIFKRDISHVKSIMKLSAFNETINLLSNLVFKFALTLMPLAIVSVVSNGLQPFFVLGIAILLTLFFPHITTEKISRKHIAQKVIAIVVMFVGSYLLNT